MPAPQQQHFADAARDVFITMGHACTFVREATGDEIEALCIFSQGVEQGFDAPARRAESVSMLIADVGLPERGDIVRVDEIAWEIQDLEADDGYVVQFSAREIETS
jgi:hypothetical protein